MSSEVSERVASARTLFASGKIGEAERELRGALELDRENLEAVLLQGMLWFRQGRVDEAIGRFEGVIERSLGSYEALVWLAIALRSRLEHDRAIEVLERAVRLDDAEIQAYTMLGLCRLAVGHGSLAEQAFAKAIEFAPDFGQGFYHLGMALRLQSRSLEALEAFETALRLSPNQPNHFLEVAKQLQHLSRYEDAITCLEEGVRMHPGSVLLAEGLAGTYGHARQAEKAEEIFERISFSNASAAVAYGEWLIEEGRFEDAVSVLERSIRLKPVQGEAFHSLSTIKSFLSKNELFMGRALKVLDRPELEPKGRMHLHYALAAAYDQRAEYGLAMKQFDLANEWAFRLHMTVQTFDEARNDAYNDGIASLYSEDLLGRLAGIGSESSKPIFIVGMIRSGTTLLDRILASHPSVASAGEQSFWNVEGGRTHSEWKASGPSAERIGQLADGFEKLLTAEAGDGLKVIDKMPLNFLHLGLIHLTFPNARIIHLRRSPLDTCLSIYTTFFGEGPLFTYSQENIVSYYQAYLRLMEHWRSVLPSDRFFELEYESLTSDPETSIRELLEFCGLPWNDACLRHDESAGAVATPSRWQVRQPIYRTSVERWRRYEPYLGKLAELKGGCPHPL